MRCIQSLAFASKRLPYRRYRSFRIPSAGRSNHRFGSRTQHHQFTVHGVRIRAAKPDSQGSHVRNPVPLGLPGWLRDTFGGSACAGKRRQPVLCAQIRLPIHRPIVAWFGEERVQ